MPEQIEPRPPVDLDAVRRRADRFRRSEDAAGSTLAPAEFGPAIEAAWDVEPLLDQVDRLEIERGLAVRELTRVRDLLLRVGNEITVELTDLTGDRAAAGAGREEASDGALAEHEPTPLLSGAWKCRCGCVASAWQGMAAHLADQVVGAEDAGTPHDRSEK